MSEIPRLAGARRSSKKSQRAGNALFKSWTRLTSSPIRTLKAGKSTWLKSILLFCSRLITRLVLPKMLHKTRKTSLTRSLALAISRRERTQLWPRRKRFLNSFWKLSRLSKMILRSLSSRLQLLAIPTSASHHLLIISITKMWPLCTKIQERPRLRKKFTLKREFSCLIALELSPRVRKTLMVLFWDKLLR